jgi:hypothetical protein
MKSTSQHCHAFINKLGFKLWLPTDFRRGSWLTTKRHGPSGLPLADRVKFGAFGQGTLASEFIVTAPLGLARCRAREAGGVGAGSIRQASEWMGRQPQIRNGGSGHCVAQPRAFDVNPLVQIRIAARPLSLNLNDWRSRLIVCDAQVPKQERAL